MIEQILAYLSFYLRAKSKRGIEQSFVREFVEEVLDEQRFFYAFAEIESLRQELLRSSESIEVLDLGAGSRTGMGKRRRVADIAKHAASTARQGRILFRLINWLQPERCLELGSSVGIGSLYQYAAKRSAAFQSIEGCPETARVARRLFTRFGAEKKIVLQEGSFAERLPHALEALGQVDYLFIDGHHEGAALLSYYEQCLPYLSKTALVVCDDIYWSKDMQAAWQQLRQRFEVQLSIDLFELGIIFLDERLRDAGHWSFT